VVEVAEVFSAKTWAGAAAAVGVNVAALETLDDDLGLGYWCFGVKFGR